MNELEEKINGILNDPCLTFLKFSSESSAILISFLSKTVSSEKHRSRRLCE